MYMRMCIVKLSRGASHGLTNTIFLSICQGLFVVLFSIQTG